MSPIWAADPFGPISVKIGTISRFPIDLAGNRYNSAAATAQPAIARPGLPYGP